MSGPVASNPVLVEVVRGTIVESRHVGAIAIADARGRLLLALGDVERPIFPRSAVKALQAIPLVESGAADAFGLGEDELAVACASHSGDRVHIEAVTSLLASWRFDRAPVGDVGWAVVEARTLLPPSVEPSKFPILTARSRSEGPTQSTEQSGTAVRTTEVQIQGETVVVKFNYCWGELPLSADTTPAEQCHSWRYEARSSGAVVLVEEGGAALPGD